MTTGDETRRDAQRKLVPVGRFGKPEEVAALITFLASDEAATLPASASPSTAGCACKSLPSSTRDV
jgi:NAD(P)-dependent dehydrogenase (short-subunit alcohol dehydrogenase family)